jgi:hypothetical protein
MGFVMILILEKDVFADTAPLIKIIYDIKSVANIGCLCNATFAKLQKASVHDSIFSIFFTLNFYGFCYDFNFRKGCFRMNCRYKHACLKCNGIHPSVLCNTFKNSHVNRSVRASSIFG